MVSRQKNSGIYNDGLEGRSLAQSSGVVIDPRKLRAAEDYTKLQLLYNNILYDFNSPIDNYIDGSFNEFIDSNVMTDSNINNITLSINNDESFESTEKFDYQENSVLFSNYQKLSNRLVDMLKQAKTEYIKIFNLRKQNEELDEDLTKLKNFLRDRNIIIDTSANFVPSYSYLYTFHLFDVSASYDEEPKLINKYKEYLSQYGQPGDGVFETERLADI